jgi:uncharacterized protein (DUF1501 family)
MTRSRARHLFRSKAETMTTPRNPACDEHLALDRRRWLTGGAASLALWSLLPKSAIAGTRDPRLLTVVLRGGLDGLSLAVPVGDPDYVKLRRQIAVTATGDRPALPLDSLFALNPNMPFLHGLYTKKQALIAHAIHTDYRERSHFDGQDVLERGALRSRLDDGWLNRALAGLAAGGKAAPKGLAMDAVVPLVMRGKAPVLSWIPQVYNVPLRDSTVARLLDLYARTDPALAKALTDGLEIGRIGAGAAAGAMATPAPNQPPPQIMKDFVEAAEAAARFLSDPNGPRIGALSYNGWDTHANKGAITGQLGNRLTGLDQALKALHDGLAPVWKDTVIVVVTEFGRTAFVNGTDGTDHGMATVALVMGGAVKGGRMLADWPGLAEKALYEARDLRPTQDLRALLKGVLRDHLGIPDGALGSTIFPDSAGLKPVDGVLAA